MNPLILLALFSPIFAQQNEIAMSSTRTESESTHYEEIADGSGLSFLNPDLQARKVARIRLPNGLQAYLISDPQADQSSAAVAVKAGSWNDPEEYPGMAHFCEHMLFMGTEKYPDCNAFFNRVSDAGGLMNAFTAPDRTVYMFSSKEEGFLENLDRFAHFFIDPLFDAGHISRELHAVDQEFAKNIEHDGWREYMVFKELSNPDHPNRKFSTGNAKTLANIPPSALRQWHTAHYSADQMRLFLYSNLSIDQLKTQAAALFSDVPANKTDASIPYAPIISPQQKGHITYVKPIQDKQTLSLTWELSPELSDDKTKSADLVAYTLNRGQEKSLNQFLKKEQLIDAMIVQSDNLGAKENGSIAIHLELTEKGIAQYKTVAAHCFEALAGLKKTGIPRYLFDEKNQIAKLAYEYQSRDDAFYMARKIGSELPDESIATYPREQLLADSYSPEKINAVLATLTPDNCAICLSADPELTGVIPDRTETWLKAEYALAPVPSNTLASWKAAKPNTAILTPEPNPFLPKDLKAAAIDERDARPILLSETERGIAYYCRAPEFAAPEASIHLFIRSPEIDATPKSAVLVSLFVDHLTDDLHPIAAAAQSAGLSPLFDLDKFRLHIQINGFSEKAPLLLNQILKKLSLNPPTKEQFDIYYARHEKDYANGAKELPVAQAREWALSLLSTDRSTRAEKLAALKTIQYQDYVKFQQKLFAKTYMEALFAGNLTFKQAESSWIDVQHALSNGVYDKASHIQPKVLQLPDQAGPFSLQRATDVQGNGTLLAIDEGPFSLERRSVQDILSPVLRESFFKELRTKQKTGYIAKAEPFEIEDRLFHTFYVQSNSHQSEDLLYRYELYLEEFLETLSDNIPKTRFESLKSSAIHSIQTRFRNLRDKAALWNLLAFEKGADFQYLDKRISALQSLTYETFDQQTRAMLARSNQKRLATLVEGRLPAPFAYQNVDAAHLLEQARYVAKGE